MSVRYELLGFPRLYVWLLLEWLPVVVLRIEGDSLKNYHMTATFREGESLTEILDLLKDAGNFTYKKENNTIILTTKLN